MATELRVLVSGGTVVVGTDTVRSDVLIENGVIVEIDSKISSNGATVLDAEGCWVVPGLVDLHTHLREPGNEEAETIETGTRAAIKGGYAAVVAMPNTNPTTDSVESVKWVRNRAAETGLCEVIVAAAITKNRENKQLTDLSALFEAGVRIFTDDGAGIQDSKLAKEAFIAASSLGFVLGEHCEDEVIANHGAMNAGELAESLGITGMPAEAEELMVMRDIALARATGAHVHFLHVSTAKSVAMVREAKRAGISVTAEATPHHFTLTQDKVVGVDTRFKVNPPLRREQDRISVLNGLRDGTIDAIATDHAPHKKSDKDKSFADAAYGMVGLETGAALAITHLDVSAVQLAHLMSVRPAQIAHLTDRHGLIAPGRAANIAIIDPSAQWVVDGSEMATKGRNNPYDGMKLSGQVLHTVVNGEILLNEGEIQR